ncbi:histidinol-phosphate transaminase [Subtercola boreus]|uniref:Histidinol-phosphate aminotransferase n=1 Tax=Subtercola boreus TaxID=120213 RepID=A0A3E0VHE4_9MICO|nr:histidinol-phosphate transaminase [Subtercola boreus]RFA08933.1 histidinol-phosphate transaminase [Subtercola boreus]TQL54082.1 histidinol phosphate aminotransferase [Subtercola boreus]
MSSLADLPIRDDLRGLKPYGAPELKVRVALNVNENTHPIPEDVARSIIESVALELRTVNRYPDREFLKLRDSLAAYLNAALVEESAAAGLPVAELTRDNIWAANGSNEILQQILQAFGGPGRSVLGFPPTYSMHPIIAAGTGTEWIPGVRDENFEISPQTAVDWVQRTNPDLVFFCAPNNPTGTPLSLETIAAAYDATDKIVVVDEAYAEFGPSGEPTALSLLEGRPRLIVSRTMSKAFAFAGARLGYLAADPAISDALRLVRLPYHLSALTQAAATAALAHAPEMLAMVDDIKGQRDRMARRLAELGYSPYESTSNFILFGGVPDPHRMFEQLLEREIIIRDLGIPNHLRVSAGTESETTAFLEAMDEITPR